MIAQNIKTTCLFLSTILTILAAFEWIGAARAYQGLLGGAFIILLLSNILDLIFSWQEDRRKFDWGIDEREYKRLMKRQAD